MCESLFFNFKPLNVSKKMVKSDVKMTIWWSQIENTFKVRDIGKVPYFDGHKLLFILAFIFTLLNYITRLAKKTGYDETKTLLHITFALVNKKNTLPARYVELWTRSENFVTGKQKRYN